MSKDATKKTGAFEGQDSQYDIQRLTGVCMATQRTLEPGEVYFAVLLDPLPEQSSDLASNPDEPEEKTLEDNGDAVTASDDVGAKNDTQDESDTKLVAETPSIGFVRRDVSQQTWDQGWRPKHLFSYWKTEVPHPNKKKRLYVDNTTLTQMLRDLEGTNEPSRLAFRYMIALMLMRKKLLRFEGVDRREDADGDGPLQDWWVFTPKLDPAKGHFGKWNEEEKLAVMDPHIQPDELGALVEQMGEVLGDDFVNVAQDDKANEKVSEK